MIRTSTLALLVLAATTLPAQTIETVGGTATAALRTNSSKSSLYGVNTSVLLIELELYLDVPGVETLTFFSYRHHSRSGSATMEWTHSVQVTGGIGPAWYSTGPIAFPLVGGNHYTLGVSWPGSLTYYYSTATTGSPVSFGTWQRAHTIANPLPPTLTIPTGVDIAQYHQRLTTVPMPAVTNVGASCSALPLVPRLVASGVFAIGTSKALELVDAAPNALAVYSLAVGPTLPVPTPLYGCSVWLNLGGPLANLAILTSPVGYATMPFTVPNAQAFVGIAFSAQAGVLSGAIDITNAIDFSIQ